MEVSDLASPEHTVSFSTCIATIGFLLERVEDEGAKFSMLELVALEEYVVGTLGSKRKTSSIMGRGPPEA